MNKSITIVGIILAIVIGVSVVLFYDENNVGFTNINEVKIFDVPEGLKSITISGKIKQYEEPDGAPESNMKPEFVLIPDKDYQEINGTITIALYNLKQMPESSEHVQITGYYNPKNPDWYYPEQTQRTQQTIFVERIVKIEPIDLGNEFTTQELRARYDKIQDEFQSQKDLFLTNEISKIQYLSSLDEINKEELKLYDDVKNHTFERDEMTEYNFWHRGVMKFPTITEQEVSKLNQQ